MGNHPRTHPADPMIVPKSLQLVSSQGVPNPQRHFWGFTVEIDLSEFPNSGHSCHGVVKRFTPKDTGAFRGVKTAARCSMLLCVKLIRASDDFAMKVPKL